MTSTTYYAMTADEQLAEAQHTLDTHITSSATGRCLVFGTFVPCYRRGDRGGDLLQELAAAAPPTRGDAAGAGRRPSCRR